MKIAQIAPVWERVPPSKYGGTELIVSLLTEELVRRGHDVTLFATGDSVTKAKLTSVYHTPPPRSLVGNPVPDLYHSATAFQSAAEGFDIIHNHTGYVGIALANFMKGKPVLSTLHGVFNEINKPFFEAFSECCYYNSISEEQRRQGPEMNYIGTVYNAIDTGSYEFGAQKEDYFVLLSRVSEDKGTHIAINVAKRANVKLILAGKIDPGNDARYFEDKIRPFVDNEQIVFKGEVSSEEKRDLLKKARAFLFPLHWEEPFGLVMPESLATGTPVIAFPRGSVNEIIEDGKTGFIVDNEEEMVEAIGKISEIDPVVCRKEAETRFGTARMTSDYLALYDKILEKGT